MLDIFQRLVRRNPRRSEADIQADVRQFILSAPFELEAGDLTDVTLESPVGDRRRIDVEAGCAVIEVKRDLRRDRTKKEAEEQLAGYVDFRIRETGLRYVGILTDGTQWHCYDLIEGHLREIAPLELTDTPNDLDRLIVWLEGVLATTHNIAPTAQNIERQLGAGSSAYDLDRSSLASLYIRHRENPTVQVKRALWSQLLTSALGTQFEDTDALFIDHTLLINTSEIIAHAVLDISVASLEPALILSGAKFTEAGIYGVVESDFFDWIVEVDGGETFVRTLAKRLSRFVWSDVDQDVLKILYENFIGAETRKRLGEYYTPDWLADAVVSNAIPDPLNSRVLDPACGSGTFLFHAIRRYIAAAEAAGHGIREVLNGVSRHVIGMDLHPVSVTLARVTYLLAIGRSRLTAAGRGDIQIPVYLGDSIQWREQSLDLWSSGNLVIRTDETRSLESDLTFPDALLDDSASFDKLINELADRASRRRPGTPPPSLRAVFTRLGVESRYHSTIEITFATMCRLHDQGRDHIWGYYIRNLARPLWLSRPGNQVDVIVGNPPWLASRYMTSDMQNSFRQMSDDRGLWAGAELAPIQDLSALFVVRVCELYLKSGGSFGMVLPNTAIDREHYSGFRSGRYGGALGVLTIAFEPSWDLRRIRPHFFPRAASVAFGRKIEYAGPGQDPTPIDPSRSMPAQTISWTGRLQVNNAPWSSVSTWLTRSPGMVQYVRQLAQSPYAVSFTQGATFVPRVAFLIIEQAPTSLGLSDGRASVRSSRSVQEKKPWKGLPDFTGVVERQFIRQVFSGENVYPFRTGEPLLAIIPCDQSSLLADEQIELHTGLRNWWQHASEMWIEHSAPGARSLMERLDYQSTLSKQLPTSPLRVVYNKSGMHVCAAVLRDSEALIGSGLYWASVETEAEATYICAILNAPTTTELTRPMMSYGKDERDIAKHVWELSIPKFDETNEIHRRLSELGALAEQIAAGFSINFSVHFAATRRHIREALVNTAEGVELDELTLELLS